MSASEREFDVVVVGSGGGALTAAISAQAAGLRPVMLEKTAKIGGTTCLSGGLFWIAANPLMREAGVADSPEAALTYLDALSGEGDVPQHRARREAYVRRGPAMVELLRALGLKVDRCDGYPDYYPDLPGASLRGRPLEPRPFDTRQLGSWRERLRPQTLSPQWLKARSSEYAKVSLARRTLTGRYALARVRLRSAIASARRVPLAVGGDALIGRLLLIALDLGIPIWTDSPVTALVSERDRIVGVLANQGGAPVRIEAKRGVILASGGFARNEEMRRQFSRQPSSTQWTKANEGETGDVLRAAMDLGAAVEHMEEAWYFPMSMLPNGELVLHRERAKPHSIIVDGDGNRFVNEAANYNLVGKSIYAHNETSPAIPSWLIIDNTHRRRYPFVTAGPGRTPTAWLESGYLKRADTVDELARRCGIDPTRLGQTVERFNAIARAGRDTDFGRGETAYDRYLADPTVTPNPSLGELKQAPFYAVAIYPGDLGTCGGLATTESAQVVRTDGGAIPGLYAAGNVASPLTGEYWGAGASIGASMTFGYIAGDSCSRDSGAADGSSPLEWTDSEERRANVRGIQDGKAVAGVGQA